MSARCRPQLRHSWQYAAVLRADMQLASSWDHTVRNLDLRDRLTNRHWTDILGVGVAYA